MCKLPVILLPGDLAGRDITVEYTASGTSWEDRSASQARGGGSGRRSPDYGRGRQRSPSRGRHSRRDSRSPPRRHTRSISPVYSSGRRSSRRKLSRSPPPRGSPTVSPDHSVSPPRSHSQDVNESPKKSRSRSPPTVPYLDANSRAASRSLSRSP